MSRVLHRLLVLAALTLVVGAGLWTLGAVPAAATETTDASDHGDAIVLVERAGDAGIVAVRLRTPVPTTAATAPHRHETRNEPPSRRALHTTESPRSAPLYTLLRAYRI